jgi:hypothetical protein
LIFSLRWSYKYPLSSKQCWCEYWAAIGHNGMKVGEIRKKEREKGEVTGGVGEGERKGGRGTREEGRGTRDEGRGKREEEGREGQGSGRWEEGF